MVDWDTKLCMRLTIAISSVERQVCTTPVVVYRLLDINQSLLSNRCVAMERDSSRSVYGEMVLMYLRSAISSNTRTSACSSPYGDSSMRRLTIGRRSWSSSSAWIFNSSEILASVKRWAVICMVAVGTLDVVLNIYKKKTWINFVSL